MEDVSGFNPKRRLCPDGTCTGIIGPNGRCGECGRTAGSAGDQAVGADVFAVLDASDDASASESPLDSTSDLDTAPPKAPGAAATAATAASAAGGTSFDPNRRLCEDGTCVGVIGSTGVCTVCGRAPA